MLHKVHLCRSPLWVYSDDMNKTEPHLFTRLSKKAASAAGRPPTFILALTIVLIWALTGPIFGYSDTWQLVINTGTTVITFLMVFLIQNTQNRDSIAVQLKLDELIFAIKDADNRFLDVEDLDEKELERRRGKMVALAQAAEEAGIDLDDLKKEVRAKKKKN
jgi:low affinity Fe/Cu permease